METNLKDFIKETITENVSIFPFSSHYFENQVVGKVYTVLKNTSLPYINQPGDTNYADYYTQILNAPAEATCKLLNEDENGKIEEQYTKKSLLIHKFIVPHIMEIYKEIKNNNI